MAGRDRVAAVAGGGVGDAQQRTEQGGERHRGPRPGCGATERADSKHRSRRQGCQSLAGSASGAVHEGGCALSPVRTVGVQPARDSSRFGSVRGVEWRGRARSSSPMLRDELTASSTSDI